MTAPRRRLGDEGVATIISGQSPPSSAYNESGDGLPFFQGKADFGSLTPVPRVWAVEGPKRARSNDVLISVRAPVGDVNMATGDCVIGRGLAAVRAGERSDPWFLYFALSYSKPKLESRATGSTFASINGSTLADLELPEIGLEDQRKIGRTLKVIAEHSQNEERSRDAALALKRAAMRELFSRGLRGEDTRDSEIGPVPETWLIASLGSLGRVGNGSTPRKSVNEYWVGGHFPWLTSAKVYDREIWTADHFVTDAALRECHLPVVEPGAVLIAITGQGKTLGHSAVLRTRATLNQHLAYLATDLGRADPSFVRGYLETQYDKFRQVGAGGGSTKGALTCAYLRSVLVPLPATLEEQRQISGILDTIDRKIELHTRKRAILEGLFKSLLHKLMTGEIRVSDFNLDALSDSSAPELRRA